MDKNKEILDNLISQLLKFDKEFIDLSAGPVEVFDDSIFQHFTELTNLQLDHCGISDQLNHINIY